VAVLASGVDRPYPAGNAALFEQIAETGLLISEWPPGSEPLRHRFLIRSRVIAAATVGTVLTEAAARGGPIQTMNRVLSLRRPAMVVPGPVTSAMSVGCHDLLRSRPDAVLVTGPAHVLEAIGRISEHDDAAACGPEQASNGGNPEAETPIAFTPRPAGTSAGEDDPEQS
jgi:DNA processing protein